MAQSYKQLQAQIESLQQQADKLRTQEVDGVVSRIKIAIAHYGLTAGQLGFGTAAVGRKSKNALARKSGSTSTNVKYSDGPGRTWSGRGPRPGWLREALANGRSLQDFASGSVSAPTKGEAKVKGKTTTTPKGKAKRKTQIRYRDRAGNTWSGMGPQPRWLKEALAVGTPLAQLAA